MITQEKLKSFVELIKTKLDMGQEEISVAAGYKRRTLTQRISQGEDLDSVYTRLQLVFGERLKSSTGGNAKAPKSQRQQQNDLHSTVDTLTEKLKKIEASSDETNLFVKAILTSQIGYGEAIGNSLDLLNKAPEGTTGGVAGTIEQRIWKMLQEKGIDAIVRR